MKSNEVTSNGMKEDVMMRVRTIYFLRMIGIKLPVFVVLSLLCLLLVDVPSVVVNAMSSVEASGSALGFFSSAFSQSMLLLKFLLIGEAVFCLLLLKDVVSSRWYNNGYGNIISINTSRRGA